ncbi:MAG: DNA repair exonuclease [Bacillota bacterium]|nr:DNA repair exonuclease [Bacillota bacterium]
MARILHCADLHLDSPYKALSPEKAAIMRKEQKEAVRFIVGLANDERADILLISGDLFDGKDALYETVLFLSDELRKLNCAAFIAPGNHDYYGFRSPYRSVSWPQNVHIFTDSGISRVQCGNIAVYGAGFDSPDVTGPLLSGFRVNDGEAAVMVMHGDMFSANSPYNPISERDIAQSGLLYLALGHVHAYSGIKKAGETHYAYPGCVFGRGFDEQGEKGVLLGEVSRRDVKLDFIPVPGRRYIEIQVPADKASSIRELASSARASVLKNSEDDIIRFTLTGEAGFDIDSESLIRELSDLAFYVCVRDKTTPKRDMWEALNEDSLKGIFLRRMKNAIEKAKDGEEREKAELAVRLGLAALNGSDLNLGGETL